MALFSVRYCPKNVQEASITGNRKQDLELFEQQTDFGTEKVSAGNEQYRKGNAKITVTDKNGNVIPLAQIKAVQAPPEKLKFCYGTSDPVS